MTNDALKILWNYKFISTLILINCKKSDIMYMSFTLKMYTMDNIELTFKGA
jgi:hypothetical protein